MSPRTLIPFSFIGTMGQIIVCSLLLQTQAKYPPYSSVNTTLIAGCALIILFAVLQIGFLASGINISNNRIIFENCMCNMGSAILLVWFAFSLWQSSYILYIWGFLSVYPMFNDLGGLIWMRYSIGRFHKFTVQ